MGLADKAFASAAAFAFFDADAMSGVEDVTVTPSGGSARAVRAVVERLPVRGGYSADQPYRPRMVLTFRNDATAGVTPAEAQAGLTVSVPALLGGSAEAFLARVPDEARPWHDAATVRVWLE